MTTRNTALNRSIALAVAAALATAVAQAQTADALDEVAVTASRIQRTGFEAPTPTTYLGADEIENRAAVRISQVLFELPAMRPTATAVPFSASAGGSYANLRNLNPGSPTQTATRTLVLVDGRRVVASTTTGLVDLNTIPTALVERVEVVTGGASAAWGSDAVAGVTNFLLKKKLDGLEANVQYGQSAHNDQRESSFSLAWGSGYAGGRGQFMLAAEGSKLTDPVTAGARSWGRNQYGWVSGAIDGVTYTRITVPGVTASGVTNGGVIVASTGAPLPTTGATAALRGIQFGPGGAVQPFTYGTYLSNNTMVGGSGAVLSPLNNLTAPVDRQSVFGRTTFDFTDNVRGFAELAYANSSSTVNTQPTYTPNGDPVFTIRKDNPFLPASIVSLMTANALTTFGLGRANPEFGLYSIGESQATVKRGSAGLDGEVSGWKWKAWVTSGSTDYYDRVPNNIKQANLRAAVDSVMGPGGTPICRINSTAAADIALVTATTYQGRGADAGCVAANPFGPGSFTSQVAGYVLGLSQATATIRQDTGGATIQGEPFAIWAGPVSLAGGIEYRKESVDQVSDATAQTSTPAFQTGGWQFANRKPLNGQYDVKEYFAETIVPLAKDHALFQALDFNAAVRATDYSTSGSVTSWKAGLTWAPFEGVLLRGTRSRDIRAANLVELFTPGVSIVGAIVDYGRTGSPTSSVPTTTVGNADLKPEQADTQTVGITWQPTGTGFHLSADWYRIDLKNAIGSFGGQNIVSACYGKAPFTAVVSDACALISRDSAGVISNVFNKTLNLAFTKTNGTDVELGYKFALASLSDGLGGDMQLRLLGTYLDKLDTNNGIVTVDRAGEIGNSRWRLTATANYVNGRFSGYLQGRYFDSAKVDNTFSATDIYDNSVPSVIYANASVQYAFGNVMGNGSLQGFLSINNLFDKAPPLVTSASVSPGQAPLAPDYDKVGRYFTLGLRYRR